MNEPEARKALIESLAELVSGQHRFAGDQFSDQADDLLTELAKRGYALSSMGTWTTEEIYDQHRRAWELGKKLIEGPE